MTWQHTPYLIPLMVSAAVSAGLGVVAYRQRNVNAAGAFALLMAASAAWTIFYTLYLSSTELEARLLFARLSTTGATLVAVAWMVFAVQYTGRRHWLTPRRLALMLVPAAATLAALFGDVRTGLFWTRFELVERGGTVTAAWAGGVGFWLHVGYSWALMSLSVVLLADVALRAPRPYRRQAAVVLVGALVPWLGNVVHLLGWIRFAANPMPFLFAFSGLAFAWAMFRFRFLSVLPIARERVIEGMDDAVLVFDGAGRLLDLNPAARRMVAADAGATAAGADAALATLLPPSLADRSVVTLRVPPEAEERVFDVRVTPLLEGGHPIGRVLVLHDVTERARLEERLRHGAFYDSLTGLPNRVLLLDRLARAVERTRRGHNPFAVLFLDLDRFKRINDSLGHSAGDQLLVGFANRLAACMRPFDTVARLSGDEFAVLLEGVDGVGQAIRVAERIQRAVAEPIVLEGQEIVPATSIGIVLSDGTRSDSAESLLRDADMAMYRAKRAGSAGYAVFDTTMHAEAMARLQLETELRRAVDRGEMTLYYQPIVAGESGELAGFEALLRWIHPERGVLAPRHFMRVAAEMGLMPRLSEWTVREAVRESARWTPFIRPGASFSVVLNVGARELVQHAALAELLEQAQAQLHRQAMSLMLDIGEAAMMERRDQLSGVMHRLAGRGVRFAVDDFGTAASSLPHLQQMPIAALKIDGRFVAGVCDDEAARGVVRTIHSLARTLGLQLFAEGVETREQQAFLRSLGCDFLQGYLLGGAVPAGELPQPAELRARAMPAGAAAAG